MSPTAAIQKKSSILLVDDNKHGLLARKAVLADQGYSIVTATNAEEAFDAFSAAAYDLVVTDFKMSRMNGIELIGKIRRTHPTVPIILLSGFVEPLGLDEKTTGADLVIAKGAHEVQHLLRGVVRLLNRRTPRKAPGSPIRGRRSKASGA